MKKIKVTKKLIKKLRPYWTIMQNLQDLYFGSLGNVEKDMAKTIGIKDIEFFRCDGEIVGIGNLERTMRLIHGEELEK